MGLGSFIKEMGALQGTENQELGRERVSDGIKRLQEIHMSEWMGYEKPEQPENIYELCSMGRTEGLSLLN